MRMKLSIDEKETNFKFPWGIAIFGYLMSFGLIFTFFGAYFWDDWYTSYTLDNAGAKVYWDGYGWLPIHAIFQVDVLHRNPQLFRAIILLSFFFSGYFLFFILTTLRFLTSWQVQAITILFLVLPINSARVAGNLAYTYSILIFYFAWFLLVTKRHTITKIVALGLFVLSFSTLSLMPFFLIPCMHFVYLKLTQTEKTNSRSVLVQGLVILLLSPAYWLSSRYFNPPVGDAAIAYLTPTKSGIIRGLLVIGCGSSVFLKLCLDKNKGKETSSRSLLIGIGLFTIALGSFSYITSGRLVDVSEWMLNFVPRASDWDSRQQLLLGLGFSVLIVGLIGDLDSQFKKYAFRILVGSCVFLNFTFMQGYMLDARKQSEVIQMLSTSETIKSGKVIMINDLAVRFNARGRLVRTYEWNGMLEKAFGDKSRSSAYFAYVDCNNSEVPIPDVLVTIDASNGRFKSLLTSNIGINMTAIKISPCPAK